MDKEVKEIIEQLKDEVARLSNEVIELRTTIQNNFKPKIVWLNQKQAATEMNCSRQHVANLDKQGIISGKLIGRKVHYRKSDCKRYKLYKRKETTHK